MGQLWIEGTADDGSEYSARWGNCSDAQADLINQFISGLLGKPDTVA